MRPKTATGAAPRSSEFLTKRWCGTKPVWNKPTQYPGRTHQGTSRERVKVRASTRQIVARGYEIGYLEHQADSPRVMLCDDRTLRVERSPQAFRKSYGLGYGSLPDRAMLALGTARLPERDLYTFRLKPKAQENLSAFLAKYLVAPQQRPREGFLRRHFWSTDDGKTFYS